MEILDPVSMKSSRYGNPSTGEGFSSQAMVWNIPLLSIPEQPSQEGPMASLGCAKCIKHRVSFSGPLSLSVISNNNGPLSTCSQFQMCMCVCMRERDGGAVQSDVLLR